MHLDRDRLVSDAVKRSNLGRISERGLDTLLHGSSLRPIDTGLVLRPEGDPQPHVHLVVSGLVRMYVASDDGRTITVRYCRAGSLIGIASIFAPRWRLPVSIEAVTSSQLLDMRPSAVSALVDADSSVARALLAEASERVQSFLEEIPLASFSTVTQRVARHLLDLASVDETGVLAAATTQEELAAAVGTVREVAARALRGLRDDRVIRTARSRIVIIDADRLVDAAALSR